MTLSANLTAPVRTEAGLAAGGAQPFGSPTVPANPGAPTITVTGNIPARPTSAPQQPQRFVFNVTAAAAVTLTARATPDTTGKTVDGYIQGDEIVIQSGATLANTVTVQDGNGPVTRGVLAVTANAFQQCAITWNGVNWLRSGGGVPVA